MKVFLEKENKEIEHKISEKQEISQVLKDLDISIESVIILKNGDVTIEEDTVEDTDSIKVLSVVSGG